MTPLGEFLDPALVHQLNQLELTARRVADGSIDGSRRSLRLGASIEFGQHRAFAQGDEQRRIDWRVFARSGKLFVREDQQESAARVMLALDQSGSMNYGRLFGTKRRYASQMIAALAYLLLSRREATGLTTFAPSIADWLSPSAARDQLALILDTLAKPLVATTNTDQSSLSSIADRLSRRSLIVIASDFFLSPAMLNTQLARLRHRRHELMLIRVLDPDEMEFPFISTVQFAGMENERPSLWNAGLVRREYLRRFQSHSDELRRICDRHKVQLHELSTQAPLADALLSVLGSRTRSR